jgi:hypothetical protein
MKNKLEPIWDFDRVKDCSLMGYMKYSREELESCFGTPHNELDDTDIADDGKVQHEWWFDIDGTPVTIYDYKESKDVPEDEPILWHIGGENYGAVLAIHSLGFEKAVTRPEYMERLENPYGHKESEKPSLSEKATDFGRGGAYYWKD